MSTPSPTTVLTVRIDRALESSLEREARRRRTSKSELVRELLHAGLGDGTARDLATEARRQSLLVAGGRHEEEALGFLEHVADVEGWE